MGVSENSVPLNPMVNDHYPYEKWLFHWEYTLFSDKPIWLNYLVPRLRAVAHVLRRQLRRDLQHCAVVRGAAEGVVAGVHQGHLTVGFWATKHGKKIGKGGKNLGKGWEKMEKWKKDGHFIGKYAETWGIYNQEDCNSLGFHTLSVS